MEDSYFAGRLKELRERSGLNQKQLAEMIGTTVRTISRLETGVQEATWPTAVALAKALGVSCEAFLQPPAERPPAGPGRPPKPSGEKAPEPPAKKAGRGRSKK
jgi:transcriptional regulator with XRE-family HTH domain